MFKEKVYRSRAIASQRSNDWFALNKHSYSERIRSRRADCYSYEVYPHKEFGSECVIKSHFEVHWDVHSIKQVDENSNLFVELATNWKMQTAHFSTTYHKVTNSNYLKIIGMGEKALPFILRDLKEGPEHWFVALNAITKENPIPNEEFGNMKEMSKAWVKWGKKHNII